MGIKRNDVPEPRWIEYDYAIRSKEDLFSTKRWRQTVRWDIMLSHIEKTRQASQMISIVFYPSKLFFDSLDLLEANLLVLDDLFYSLTGIRIAGTDPDSEEVLNKFGFWNMDCYQVLKKMSEELRQIRDSLLECLKLEPIWDVSLKVKEIESMYSGRIGQAPDIRCDTSERFAYTYACGHYHVAEIDKDALATQITNVLLLIDHYALFFYCIYGNHFDFTKLLAMFCQSEKAQTEFIEPWRHDLGGTRDNLIAKMEKDPKLGPWVHKYDHLSKEKTVLEQLFYSEKDIYYPTDEDECYNTDNWLSILTIAAVLQEYDEQHIDATDAIDYETLVLKLTPYFRDEGTVKRFLAAVHGEKDTKVITFVANYYNNHLCTDVSKDLWEVLHQAKIYKARAKNWYAQIGLKIK